MLRDVTSKRATAAHKAIACTMVAVAVAVAVHGRPACRRNSMSPSVTLSSSQWHCRPNSFKAWIMQTSCFPKVRRQATELMTAWPLFRSNQWAATSHNVGASTSITEAMCA